MTESNNHSHLPNITQTVHAGERRYRSHNSLTVPIVQTSVYTFGTSADLVNYFEERMFWDEVEREEYGRYGNPTVRAVEAKLAALEGADDAVLLSSGMAAVTNTLLLLLKAGDHLILTDDCYHQSREFCEKFLPRMGIESTIVPCGDCDAVEAALQPNTRLLYTESPTNPFMRCVDYERVVEIAKAHDLITVVDATFATPVNCRPLAYGIDLVIHSLTKYLGGHNDLMAGAVVGSFQQTTRIRQAQAMLGSIADPHGAYLMLRGMKTLGLRIAQHNANGLAVARFLEDHPKVRKVWYPGLESHPDHELAKATMAGYGGVVSFEIEGDGALAYQFIDALKIPHIGPSLGGVETMVSPLAVMGYAELPEEERLALGIRDELVRFCCGVEATQDLLDDLAQALNHI